MEAQTQDTDLKCPICLEFLVEKDPKIQEPYVDLECGHSIHNECIAIALSKFECPICRTPIKEKFLKKLDKDLHSKISKNETNYQNYIEETNRNAARDFFGNEDNRDALRIGIIPEVFMAIRYLYTIGLPFRFIPTTFNIRLYDDMMMMPFQITTFCVKYILSQNNVSIKDLLDGTHEEEEDDEEEDEYDDIKDNEEDNGSYDFKLNIEYVLNSFEEDGSVMINNIRLHHKFANENEFLLMAPTLPGQIEQIIFASITLNDFLHE
jgi:hypothetical protein